MSGTWLHKVQNAANFVMKLFHLAVFVIPILFTDTRAPHFEGSCHQPGFRNVLRAARREDEKQKWWAVASELLPPSDHHNGPEAEMHEFLMEFVSIETHRESKWDLLSLLLQPPCCKLLLLPPAMQTKGESNKKHN